MAFLRCTALLIVLSLQIWSPIVRADESEAPLTALNFLEPSIFYFHSQATSVTQYHGAFPSSYSGPNSLSSVEDTESSFTTTAFLGVRVNHQLEFYLNPEVTGGTGFSKTDGIAGFPNGEIYRVGDSSPQFTLARIYLKQVIGFGGETEVIKEDINQIESRQDIERFTLIMGKFALNDFLDKNQYSHDPRTQFLNWMLMDLGAWDYAADTKGYTWGIFFEYNIKDWALRWASAMVATSANQMQLDPDLLNDRGDNLELEYRYQIKSRPGASRILVYENHANMGNYRATINTPAFNMDITQSRSLSVKYGLGLNMEQEFADEFGGFLRASWDNGTTESWAFAEVDSNVSLGAVLKGRLWKRNADALGMALVVSQISNDHRDYLNAGGLGFMLGDRHLTYAPEQIAEIYYLAQINKNFAFTGDLQMVENPAYNSDRGPVSIFSIRLHYEN